MDKYFELSNVAYNLRTKNNYKDALKIYNEMIDYVKKNNIILNNKTIAYLIAGKACCLRKNNETTEYKKYISAENATFYINRVLKLIPDFDLKESYSAPLKNEIIWSYLRYYLSDFFKDTSYSIHAAKKIKLILDDNNEIAFNTLLSCISNKLLKNDIIQNNLKDIEELLYMFPYGDNYLKPSKNDLLIHSLSTKSRHRISSIINSNQNLSEEQLKEKRIRKARENSIISAKFKVLYFKEEYQKIIDCRNKIFEDGEICNVAISVERTTSRAYLKLGDYKKAIESLENALAEFGIQAYIYKDIAEIYLLSGNKNKAILNYYKYCLNQSDKKNINNVLLSLAKIVDDKELVRKYLNLYFLIQEKNNWNEKDEAKLLRDSIDNYNELFTEDFKSLLKELLDFWTGEVDKYEETFNGKIIKIMDNKKFGFIEYDKDKEIFFKMKKINVKIGDNVNFRIEKNYDKSKKVYSNAAVNIRIIK